jgi:hypothetical protein
MLMPFRVASRVGVKHNSEFCLSRTRRLAASSKKPLAEPTSTAAWGVIGLDEAFLRLHDAAFRIGEVSLRLGIRFVRWWCRRFARLLAAFSIALLFFFRLDEALFLRGQFGLGLQRRHRLLGLRQPFLLVAGPFRLRDQQARQQYLRKLLIQRASSALQSAERNTPLGHWAKGLLARAHKNNAVIALANKLARIRLGRATETGEVRFSECACCGVRISSLYNPNEPYRANGVCEWWKPMA